MRAMPSLPARSACAAKVSLHWVRYCIGGAPIMSVKRSASAFVAGEIAADESRRFPVSAVAHLDQTFERLGADRGRRKREIRAENMPVVMREEEKVAGCGLDLLASLGEPRPA